MRTIPTPIPGRPRFLRRPQRSVWRVARLLAVVLLVSPASSLRAQTPTLSELRWTDDYDEVVEESRSIIRAIMEEEGVPGASIAVGHAGTILWAEGFGWANLELRVPVTPLTKFRVGSVSKTMTASAIGLLLDRGLLDLDAPVQNYVPEFPEKRWPITSRQLGGHLAGIRHYRGREMLSADHYPTVDAGLAIFDADSLLFEPGTDYSYSSYGWNLLSAVIEGASGEEFLAFMRDEVFEPLGLRHTVPDQNSAIIAHRTEFYESGPGGAVINAPYVDNSYKWAGGGFLSTPEDLVKFAQAHMQPGFLSETALRTIMQPQSRVNGETTNYGIGWSTGRQGDGDQTLGHSGGSVGGTTLLLVVPAHDLVVAGVVNVSGPAGAIVNRVAEAWERHLSAAGR